MEGTLQIHGRKARTEIITVRTALNLAFWHTEVPKNTVPRVYLHNVTKPQIWHQKTVQRLRTVVPTYFNWGPLRNERLGKVPQPVLKHTIKTPNLLILCVTISEVLCLEHSSVWRWNLDTSENWWEIPAKFWNVLLEKDGDQLDWSCEKWGNIT